MDKSTAFCEEMAAGCSKGFQLLTEFRRFLFVITNQCFRSPHNRTSNADWGSSSEGKAGPNLMAVTIYVIMLLRLTTCEIFTFILFTPS
jgi:hypothetical protein